MREIKPILSDIQSSIEHNSDKIKWVPLENIHMTLSFIGNIFLDDIPKLIRTLKAELTTSHFIVSIEKTGVFPSIIFPKILWMGIGNGTQKLIKLYKKVEKAITVFNVVRMNKDFVPHITIGKIAGSYGKIDVLPFMKYVYSPRELKVNYVVLYESQLLPEGTKYKVLTKLPLN